MANYKCKKCGGEVNIAKYSYNAYDYIELHEGGTYSFMEMEMCSRIPTIECTLCGHSKQTKDILELFEEVVDND